MDWEEFKKKSFTEDPELKKEYDKLEPEYRIISQIIELRKKNKITQKQLAELISTKQPSIARLESGDYNPSLDFLKKIADVLDAYLEVNFISKAGR
jgi:predicted transcriptional regulator